MRYILLVLNICIVQLCFSQIEGGAKLEELAEKGKYKEAIKLVDELIAVNPEMASYHQFKAECQFELKDFVEAFETMDAAIRLMPDSTVLWDMRGNYYDMFGLNDLAVKDFANAIETTEDPELLILLYANLGGSKYKVRDFDGAYEDLSIALEMDNDNISAMNNIAMVCDELGRKDETLAYLKRIVEIEPDNPVAYVNLGFFYQQGGKHALAIEHLDKAIELDPGEAFAYSNRSFSKLKLNDTKGALKDVNKSIGMNQINSYAYKIKALILIEMGKKNQACENLNTALELEYREQYGDEVDLLIRENCIDFK
ncbi:MAG: tetratricopeptide repeat protein [Crocinitomicaceae bacterium]|nr:tetratricopeptide repeat protein [Crocinitomicaceae bacterium]